MTEERSTIAALVGRLAQARVVCVGDAMLDRFVLGSVDRVSPEAPIPVLRVEREQAMLGGAANVVRNLSALGAAARFVGVIGDDAAGAEVMTQLAEQPGAEPSLVISPGRRTTIKERFVAGMQQLLRADREATEPLSAEAEGALISHIGKVEGALALSDYGKGVLSDAVLKGAIAAASGRPIVVDPKGADFRRYRGATVVTPNRKELALATSMPVDTDRNVMAAARRITETCGIANVLVTLSEHGMMLVPGRNAQGGDARGGDARDGAPTHLPAEAREVFDVSGAGDTVVAALAASLSVGAPLLEAARLANVAAGIAVGKLGTAVVYPDEILHALHAQELMGGEAKVLGLGAALDRIQQWRRKGQKIGFTNGCFDLLHPGHVSLLAQSRAACDRLVVGLNSDASVRRLKGKDRPVQPEAARAVVLASLQSVDLVVVFDEDTPIEIIRAVKPDLLVKGADYTVETVVGADAVQAHGGKVLLADILPGHSTSATIKKLAR
jgi:D-beta-D-heptose 7-phosphate kinase/D-beta-D-heptose 1-phosphate adenosyltransferase